MIHSLATFLRQNRHQPRLWRQGKHHAHQAPRRTRLLKRPGLLTASSLENMESCHCRAANEEAFALQPSGARASVTVALRAPRRSAAIPHHTTRSKSIFQMLHRRQGAIPHGDRGASLGPPQERQLPCQKPGSMGDVIPPDRSGSDAESVKGVRCEPPMQLRRAGSSRAAPSGFRSPRFSWAQVGDRTRSRPYSSYIAAGWGCRPGCWKPCSASTRWG